jgi:predicted PurR-regulated permease PerM
MSPSTVKITVVSIMLFITATGGFVFLLLQAQQQGEQLLAQLTTIDEQRAQEESYYRLQRIAEDSAEDRMQLNSYFFSSEGESVDFLNMVERLAPAAGVTLVVDTLSMVEDSEGGKQWVEIDFSFEGSRSRVQNFLIILEELPYVANIKRVEMVTSSQTKWQSKVTMQVQVLTYDE